jgi:hypothetical protein
LLKSVYPVHVAVSVVELALWVLSHSTLYCNAPNSSLKNYSGQQWAQAGIQQKETSREADKNEMLSRLAGISFLSGFRPVPE